MGRGEGSHRVKKQTFQLDVPTTICTHLAALSCDGVRFYNAALEQRNEESGILSRTKQFHDRDIICKRVGIEPLARSVMYELLRELDIATFGKGRVSRREMETFYPLTWTGSDIEIVEERVLLPSRTRTTHTSVPSLVSIPFPVLNRPSGILTSVHVSSVSSTTISVTFHWRDIPSLTGPGRAINRSFGYTPTVGAIEGYIVGIIKGLNDR